MELGTIVWIIVAVVIVWLLLDLLVAGPTFRTSHGPC